MRGKWKREKNLKTIEKDSEIERGMKTLEKRGNNKSAED